MRLRILAAVLFGAMFGGAAMYELGEYRAQRERQQFVETISDAAVETVTHIVEREGDEDAEARAHVIDLPEDAQTYHTSIFTSSDWKSNATERQFVASFEADAQLRNLKVQTHWHHYTPEHRLYYARFGRAIRQTPAVMVQDATGKVIFKASGANARGPVRNLVRAIAKAIRDCCPLRPKPAPDDTPDTPPLPDEKPPQVDPIPDIMPIDEPTRAEVGLPLAAGILGAIGAALVGWRSRTT